MLRIGRDAYDGQSSDEDAHPRYTTYPFLLPRQKQVVLFLDYDGTLSPIVEQPEKAFMKEGMRPVLAEVRVRELESMMCAPGEVDVEIAVMRACRNRELRPAWPVMHFGELFSGS